jgi:hypothetical protein
MKNAHNQKIKNKENKNKEKDPTKWSRDSSYTSFKK